jgi:dihydroxy-acid dehydratase
MALGGSTNAVLHLLAIAFEAEVDLTLDDFHRIGKKVPHLADTSPMVSTTWWTWTASVGSPLS